MWLEYDKQFVKIDRFFPSSKMCFKCGWINQDLTLNIREWKCTSCGEKHDRDLNASINILKEGLKIYGKELAITKVESESDFSNKAHSMKPETH